MEEKITKEFKDLERKISRQRKEKSEEIIKEKLDKKKLDYDTIALIIEIFEKSKFKWHKEHFETFDSKSNNRIVVEDKSKIAGKKLSNVKFPNGSILGAIIRNGAMDIPSGESVITTGDRVIVFSLPTAIKKVNSLFCK